MPNIKFYLVSLLAISLSVALYALRQQLVANGELSNEKSRLESVIQSKDELYSRQIELTKEASEREILTAQEAIKKDEEFQKLRDCVNSGKCSVRVRNGSDNKLPDTTASGSGATKADASDTRRLEQDFLRIAEHIGIIEVRYEALQRELIARSKSDFCSPK